MIIQRKRAFTLTKLLVVIAIICILSAILFPVFGRVREGARRAACQSNLSQIGLGVKQYMDDYNQCMPFSELGANAYGSSDPTSNPPSYKWMDAIYPYVKNEQIFDCPDQKKNVNNYLFYKDVGAANTDYGGYAANVMYPDAANAMYPNATSELATPAFPSIQQSDTMPVSSAMFQDPTETALVLEHGGTAEGRTDWRYYVGCTGPGPGDVNCATGPSGEMNVTTGSDGLRYVTSDSSYTGYILEGHLGTTNVLWADGHVKAMKLEDLLAVGTAVDGSVQLMKYFTDMKD